MSVENGDISMPDVPSLGSRPTQAGVGPGHESSLPSASAVSPTGWSLTDSALQPCSKNKRHSCEMRKPISVTFSTPSVLPYFRSSVMRSEKMETEMEAMTEKINQFENPKRNPALDPVPSQEHRSALAFHRQQLAESSKKSQNYGFAVINASCMGFPEDEDPRSAVLLSLRTAQLSRGVWAGMNTAGIHHRWPCQPWGQV